ncbi:type II toxin-antitoxin system VapC family toxin [Candidatus Poribacteria bacterium]|nr:type II toxin-antitoxin system VapC family toxin [Candidatus Poribacteria bacterium]
MNHPLYILDTDTASRHGRRGIARVATLPAEQVCLTVITQIEMREGRYHGLRTAANKEQLLRAWQLLQDTETFLSQFVILPVDEAAATVFDRLVKMKLGKIGRSDLLIASIALSRNAILVTHNVKDFKRVPNLEIEDWVSR